MTTKNYYGNNPNFAQAFGGKLQINPQEIAQGQARMEAFPYINDSIVSIAAGIGKFPSDVGSLFNAEWANNWENEVNLYRNQNQSKKLNHERMLATKAINNGMPLAEVAKKYPYASAQYGLEVGSVPLSGTIKGAKIGKNIYKIMKEDSIFNRAKRVNSAKILVPASVAYTGSIPTQAYSYNLYRDYKENRGNNG